MQVFRNCIERSVRQPARRPPLGGFAGPDGYVREPAATLGRVDSRTWSAVGAGESGQSSKSGSFSPIFRKEG